MSVLRRIWNVVKTIVMALVGLLLVIVVFGPKLLMWALRPRRIKIKRAIAELDVPDKRYSALNELRRLRPPEAAPRLAQGLASGDPIFGDAVEILVAIGEPSVRPLLDALPTAAPPQRRRMLDTLSQIDATTEGSALLPWLRDADGWTRMLAARAAGAIALPNAELEAELERAHGDPYPLMPLAAARALARIRLRASHAAGLELLARPELALRIGAADVAGEARLAEAVPTLESLALDADGQVAHAAVRALGRVGDPALGSLERLLQSDRADSYVRGWVVSALADLGSDAAWRVVDSLTGDADDAVARLAQLARTLRALPPEDPFRPGMVRV